jgi:hypothetical protein
MLFGQQFDFREKIRVIFADSRVEIGIFPVMVGGKLGPVEFEPAISPFQFWLVQFAQALEGAVKRLQVGA